LGYAVETIDECRHRYGDAARVSAISTLAVLVSLWAVLQTRQAQQVAAYRSVHELYDKMVQLKFENPDFLITARDWDPSKMRCVFTMVARN
jgi:hypothetical protein